MEIKRFDDFIICPIPAESELDQVEIEKIVAHTREIHPSHKTSFCTLCISLCEA